MFGDIKMTRRIASTNTIIATTDDDNRETENGYILVRNNRAEAVGPTADCPRFRRPHHRPEGPCGDPRADQYMFQSLTRTLLAAQNCELFDWLSILFPVWQNITPAMQRASSRIALAELMLSGCTTAADHAYLHVNDITLDDSFQAVTEMGIRFHGARGAMSLGQSKIRLPPDELVEQGEDAILRDMLRVVDAHHDHRRML